MVGVIGFEPTTPASRTKVTTRKSEQNQTTEGRSDPVCSASVQGFPGRNVGAPAKWPDDLLDLLAPIGPPETQKPRPAATGAGLQSIDIRRDVGGEYNAEIVDLLAPQSPLDRVITVSTFTTVTDVHPTAHRMTLRQVADMVTKPRSTLPVNASERERETAKKRLPLLKLGAYQGTRSKDAFVSIEGVEGDYDAGLVSVDLAIERLRAANLAAVVYTTPSHTTQAPRWRVLCPTSKTLSAEDGRGLCERVNGALHGILGPESFDGGRAYFYGGLGGDPCPVAFVIEGRAIDLAWDVPRIAKGDRAPGASPAPEVVDLLADDDDYLACFRTDWAEIDAALPFIPADERDVWLRVGMALHNETGGSDKGFERWAAWSQASEKYDDRDQRRTWQSFGGRRRGEPVRLATLFDLAKSHGWKVEPATEGDELRLNRRHAVVAVRGRTLITTEREDGSIDFGTERDLHAYYANDRLPISDKQTEPISKAWMRAPSRRTYPDGVTFAPGGCGPSTLNLWRGWAVEPDAGGSCALFLDHIRRVICRGNVDHEQYLLGWMAHLVQRPHEKPGVGLVLRGAKGAGKDTVADYLSLMIGRRHAPTVAESDHIVGKFNARLEAALLLHVQEGSWAGDHRAEGVLKYLVTSDRIEIERKGIDSINLPSVVRLFISANAEWVVPASADERRWAVFELCDGRRGDGAYFSALRDEMNGRGPAALLHFLQHYDLGGFDVRAAPDTDGLLEQKLTTLQNADLWWFEMLSRGDLPTAGLDEGTWADRPQSLNRATLRTDYAEWMKGRRYDGETLSERSFGKRLRAMLPALGDRRVGGRRERAWQYTLPPLAECRAAFATWIGSPIAWDGDA